MYSATRASLAACCGSPRDPHPLTPHVGNRGRRGVPSLPPSEFSTANTLPWRLSVHLKSLPRCHFVPIERVREAADTFLAGV